MPVHRLPSPPDIPALRMRGVQMSLWQRLRSPLRFLTVGAAALASLVTIRATLDTSAGFGAAAFGTSLVVGLFATSVGFLSALPVGRIAWRLRNVPWRSYDVVDFRFGGEQLNTMTLVDGERHHPVRIPGNARSESLEGMIRPQVWFVGDPTTQGILVPAGGGELLWAYSFPTPPLPVIRRRPTAFNTATTRTAQPVMAPLITPADPVKALRQAAKVKERAEKEEQLAARFAARNKEWLDKHPPKPPKPEPAPEPSILPKIRGGRKIKWQ